MNKYGWVICLPANNTACRPLDRYYPAAGSAFTSVTNVQNARVFDSFMEANDYRARETNNIWVCESQLKRVSLTPVVVRVELAP